MNAQEFIAYCDKEIKHQPKDIKNVLYRGNLSLEDKLTIQEHYADSFTVRFYEMRNSNFATFTENANGKNSGT